MVRMISKDNCGDTMIVNIQQDTLTMEEDFFLHTLTKSHPSPDGYSFVYVIACLSGTLCVFGLWAGLATSVINHSCPGVA